MRACMCNFTARDELKKFALSKGAKSKKVRGFFLSGFGLWSGRFDYHLWGGKHCLLLGSFMPSYSQKFGHHFWDNNR